ncbi:MAG TPA: hypothetical protein VEB22_05390 [Phycisphaerales bacterium]|nr:hypothetical protein [Phycisphaerales bacterium]
MGTDNHPSIPLSGKVHVAPHPWAVHPRSGGVFRCTTHEPRNEPHPTTGDLRLAVTINQDARTLTTDDNIGRGHIVASFFDGLCWGRFDLASLTRNTAFDGRKQLNGVLRWIGKTAQEAEGRPCTCKVPDGTTFPRWSLLPAVTVPQRAKSPEAEA